MRRDVDLAGDDAGGDGWQFISYSGTVYPLVALGMCDALPAENGRAQGR